MKKISFLLMAFGLMVTSCTKDDFDYQAYMDNVKQDYNDLFTLTFGEIAPGHDWGFHADATGNRAAMRAVFDGHWDGVHNFTNSSKVPCGINWTDSIPFEIPSDAVKVDQNTQIKSGSAYYVPKTFNGTINFDNFNGDLYVAGTVTGFNGNPGTLNLYILEKGSWKKGFTTGTINIYNNGDLVLGGTDLQNSNVQAIYNAGYFSLGTSNSGLNTSNAVKLYSTGIVELTGTGTMDYKFVTDIHGKLKVNGNIKIQNGTPKYICGIEATGKVENVDGPLVTSNIIANELSFDGNPIYLTKGGHIKVTKTISIPNSNSHVYAVTGSTALVESKNFEFGNKNDFTHTFSDNIYFKVNSGYIKVDNCYAMGSSHNFSNIDEYLAYTGHSESQSDEFPLAKDRINAGSAEGYPECGQPWSIGPEITYARRIIAEDLSAGQFRADFDFNDVVFDAVVKVENGRYVGYVKVLAAGGTLPLYIGIPLESEVFDDAHEVHKLFGKSTGTMINTGTELSTTVKALPKINGIDLGPVNAGDDIGNEDFMIKKINDIPVVVVSSVKGKYLLETNLEYNGGYETTAPMKIAVPTTYQWTQERKEIQSAYSKFSDYVKDKSPENWYDYCDDQNLLYKGNQ